MIEIRKKLYDAWTNFVSLTIIKIRRKKYQFSESMIEKINVYENELEEQLISFPNYLMDYQDVEKEKITNYDNDRNIDHIISISENITCFEYDNGKIYNIWNRGKAPRKALLSGKMDGNYRIKIELSIDEKSKENAYQAGIYIKNVEGDI